MLSETGTFFCSALTIYLLDLQQSQCRIAWKEDGSEAAADGCLKSDAYKNFIFQVFLSGNFFSIS